MNYISLYGLEFNPYIKDIRNNIIIETPQYKEVSTRLDYLLQLKGFGLLTGNPGMGKTTAIRKWTDSLNKAAVKVIYIPLSTLTVNEFYRNLALQLGCEPRFRKHENFTQIQSSIERLSIEKKVTPIIILDEANYMKSATFNDLKILFNFEMDSLNRALILLSGLPVINSTLSLNAHEPLKQRIVMNYEMEPLSQEESKDYLLEKLKKANCHQEVFDSNALEAIVSSAGGVPRLLDKYANSSLLIAYKLRENIISASTVMKAVEDTQL